VAKIPDSAKAAALIFAPQGRDASVAESLMREAGIASVISSDIAGFTASLGEGVAFAVLTEEAVRFSDLKAVAAWVTAQPSWSDLPFIVLTQHGGGPERNPAAARLSEILGNVTFLERPFHATTFISVARTALRGRRRQYEARNRIEDLREGEGRLQTALLAGRLGTWELDLSTRELISSDVCKAVFGRGPGDEFGYQALVDGIHPDSRPEMLQAMRHAVSSVHDYAIECRTIWPDGSTHWAELRARLVTDRKNRTRRLVGVTTDITARKHAETDLRSLNETLEERVAERTAELYHAHQTLIDEVAQRERAEEQLRQSQKMEAIGQLTGGVAHDFNNLLMAVLGNLDLLRKHLSSDPKATRLIEGALRGAQRGASLTQRLLAFARRQDLQVEPVDLVALVSGMHDLLERSVGSDVDLEIDLPASLPLAFADGNQVELALLNLAVNARDAMPDGGVLSISLRPVVIDARQDDLPAGEYLCLSVRDTGQGMDAETLKKAIDPFFSTKEVGKGTGLGLSMIHGLAVQLNGALRLSSEVGKGTTAELLLPVTMKEVLQMPAAPATVTPTAGPEKATILLVDDDALIAMSTVDMLEDLGHAVLEANSGAEALALLESGSEIDLMITDYSMPGMTGGQLAKAALALRPNLPIVLATGYADLPPGAGIDLPRLGKPYTQDQLAVEIAKALK
jgi:PAS domain S-box-containing protein